ncbi:MAG: beta-propeller domain-containing protein [Clostridiales bacterium]|jgi:uncharacterized secreted protein with C-terminal beta-propeller domain|nr:beta-propeller domain-containing protein [Clostridiales bacterium]
MKRPFILLVFVLAVLVAAASFLSGEKIEPITDPGIVELRDELPVVGSAEKLIELISDTILPQSGYFIGETRAVSSMLKTNESADSASYSTTNIQVAGVDEADVVKTDGRFIYQINDNRVVVAEVYGPENMEIIKIYTYEDGFMPSDLYVDEQYLAVIGSNYYYNRDVPKIMAPEDSGRMMYPAPNVMGTVKVIVYDISNKQNIRQVRDAELEGGYLTSRKIGSVLYLLSNQYVNLYQPEDDIAAPPAPTYRDTAGENTFQSVSYDEIRYFPGFVEPNYLLIGTLDLSEPQRPMDVATYLGSGQNIYASTENLYIAGTRYDWPAEPKPDVPGRIYTVVYKFALKNTGVEYVAQGEVPGTVLNQFSMDEHDSYFRIATTTRGFLGNTQSKNQLYILDDGMQMTGFLEDIAPGEQIYSVRFMGGRGYMVTFETVDPLFVIDLSNPYAPEILGELKIPGYSNYLHPYDENHIIGFGKDAEVVGNMAYYLGMKIALFDVSDVENPVEKFTEMIGTRGTESELLYNHKALLFSREKSLLAFPVTVLEATDGKKNADGSSPCGQFAFQGAYVYQIDLINGFTLKNKITHLTESDIQASRGEYWYYSTRNVERILYIGDTLYTLSREQILSHNLNTGTKTGNLTIPGK